MHRIHPHPGPSPRGRGRIASPLAALAAFVSLLAAPGCHPNKRYDLIEAELRTRDQELADTRTALEQARNLNRAYAQQAAVSGQPPAPGNAPVYVPVKEIALGRGTGALTGETGDNGLMIVVVPRDEDGAAVKVPARMDVSACDVTAAGQKVPIGNWDVSAEKLRPTWRSGFLSTGYFVLLPWQTRPCTGRVRLVVRLTTLDGRTFETDRDIAVQPGGPRPSNPDAAPVVPSPAPNSNPPREPLLPDPLPPGTQELPAPKGAPERGVRLMPAEKAN